jgi:hypothetical protein
MCRRGMHYYGCGCICEWLIDFRGSVEERLVKVKLVIVSYYFIGNRDLIDVNEAKMTMQISGWYTRKAGHSRVW